jgi:hypothetical protein
MPKPSKKISTFLKTGNMIGPDKCEVFSISRKKQPVTFTYNLHGQQLKSNEAAKYLGVTISKDLSWTNNINNTSNYHSIASNP